MQSNLADLQLYDSNLQSEEALMCKTFTDIASAVRWMIEVYRVL